MVTDARHRLATVRKLPYDAEIEFLESTGTQWIDTEWADINATSINLSARILGYGDILGNGSYNTYQNGCKILGNNSSNNLAFAYYKPTGSRVLLTANQGDAAYPHELSAEYAGTVFTLAIDGVVGEHGAYTGITSDETYKIGFRGVSSAQDLMFYGKIISITIQADGQFVRDYIPVRFTNELGQSEGAMYDKVSGQLFRNQGSGEFVMGPDVIPYDAEIEYLESTGTQYIDTGLMAHSNIGWKIDGQILVGTGNYAVLIGAQDYDDVWFCEVYERGSEGVISIEAWYSKNVCSLIGHINTRTIATFNFLDDGTAFINPSEHLTDRENIDWTAFRDYDVHYCLFASGSNQETTAGYVMSFSQSRIYSCQMSDGNNLVRDFIPVRVGTTGYMYDRANPKGGPLGNGLYPNQGSGDFILGKDVAYPKRKFEITYRKPQIYIAPPTARDYISDGLIALWDGIENADWGTHDDNATVWKDLSGNNNTLTLLNNAKFDDNSLITANRDRLTASIDKKLPYITIEVCAFQDTSRNSSALICFGNSINSNWMFTASWAEIQTESPGYDLRFTNPLDNSIPHTWCGVCNANSGEREYVDGKHIVGTYRSNGWSPNRTFGLSGGNGYSAWNFVGNYYCVRLYSRALTASEIAHNYAIDKIRFNLP